MKIPRHVRTLGGLVRWIAETHHDGAVFPIAERSHLSPGIVARWAHDTVKTPKLGSVIQLADAYSLETQDVLALVYRALEEELARQGRLIAGELRRPRPSRPIAGGSGVAQPLPDAKEPGRTPSYRKSAAGACAAMTDAFGRRRLPDCLPAAA